ncbi:MAG: Acetylglucosamine-phosphate uridylyltransferase [Microbacteriaceae bacterium]|jgi:UDP-2-acetamido-3-amino-2,3-dideoxy-glucuronate N-acetyltransferase|nr:Acetylglucosamine-phosphate uridylyltransferase [Microbacteriaceae bacterium]
MADVEGITRQVDVEEPPRIAPSADIDPRARVGPGSVVLQLAEIREYAQVSSGCTVGRGVYIGPGVIVGRNCMVQGYATLYEPALLEDGVFVGAGVIFTNELHPRAVNPDGSRKTDADWKAVGVTVRTGASVGARAVCVAPITIGRWALVGAGAVVTTDVPDFALMVGVPAFRTGWVGRSGHPLKHLGDGYHVCPETGDRYRELNGALTAL